MTGQSVQRNIYSNRFRSTDNKSSVSYRLEVYTNINVLFNYLEKSPFVWTPSTSNHNKLADLGTISVTSGNVFINNDLTLVAA